jgi:peptidoglycan/xylan/chitin deacetylase (PgdA/CDA1 family)
MGKLRRLCKTSVAGLVHHSRKLIPPGFFRHQQVCVFGLHRVLTEAEWSRSNSLDGMIVTDVTFDKLLEDLQRRFEVVSLETALRNGAGAKAESRPRCVLTFDDGWSDTYWRAYPSLSKFGLPATVFIATGAIEHRGGFWVEQLNKEWKDPSSRARIEAILTELRNDRSHFCGVDEIVEWLKHMPSDNRDPLLSRLLPPQQQNGCDEDNVDSMMTWNQVIEMSRNGIEIGAHTVTHPLLTYENDSTVEHELRASKETLEEKVGKNIRSFAYPNGDCDPRVRRYVEQAGFLCALSTRPGWYSRREDPYTIRRILVHEGILTGSDGRYSPAMLSLALTCWG